MWTSSTFDVDTFSLPLERFYFNEGDKPYYNLILAAHCLEHFVGARSRVQQLYGMLCRPGELWIIVPDDSDPVNPDHLWFFTEDSLSNMLHQAGFTIKRITTKKVIERENFIYCIASKP
jgi:hypothetical protein